MRENLKPTLEKENRNGRSMTTTNTLREFVMDCPACPPAKKFRKSKGQQLIEYGVLLTALTTALLIMYVYTKRGLQAVIRDSASQIGSQGDSHPRISSIVTSSNGSQTMVVDELTNINRRGDNTFSDFYSVTTSEGRDKIVQEVY